MEGLFPPCHKGCLHEKPGEWWGIYSSWMFCRLSGKRHEARENCHRAEALILDSSTSRTPSRINASGGAERPGSAVARSGAQQHLI